MFVPTLRNGLSEDEAIQTYATFSKRPVDEIKEGILKKYLKNMLKQRTFQFRI